MEWTIWLADWYHAQNEEGVQEIFIIYLVWGRRHKIGEKVYKPIVKDVDHLICPKDNPGRVKGLKQNENNQNPDII